VNPASWQAPLRNRGSRDCFYACRREDQFLAGTGQRHIHDVSLFQVDNRVAFFKLDPLCRQLEACAESSAAAQITVSTKAKGLEWRRVLMSSDFNKFVVKNLPIAALYQANENLKRWVAGRTVLLSLCRSPEFSRV
jgi:hypothetical protein